MTDKKDDMAIAGEGLTITIAGKEYKKRKLTIGDFAALESFIKSQRIKELHDALEDSKPRRTSVLAGQVVKNPDYDDWLEQKSKLTMEVAQASISTDVLNAAAETVSGIRFLFKRLLDGNDMPPGGIDELVTPDNMAEMNAVLRADEAVEGEAESPPAQEETGG